MKIHLVLLLGAMCVVSSVAHAQTLKEAPSRSIKDLLKQNPYSRDNTRPAGVRLFAAPGDQGFNAKLGVDIVRQDSGEALRQLAKVLGVNIVIDPAIQFLPAKTRALYFNYIDDDVFDSVSKALVRNEAIETWKSSAGTYFFAAKPAVTPNGLVKESGERRLESEKRDKNSDPFVFNPGIKPQVEPQPHWEKRQFNGRDFYFIPAPKQ